MITRATRGRAAAVCYSIFTRNGTHPRHGGGRRAQSFQRHFASLEFNTRRGEGEGSEEESRGWDHPSAPGGPTKWMIKKKKEKRRKKRKREGKKAILCGTFLPSPTPGEEGVVVGRRDGARGKRWERVFHSAGGCAVRKVSMSKNVIANRP